MIIKRIFNLSTYQLKCSLKIKCQKNLFLFTQITERNKKQLLNKTLEQVSLKKSSSIIMDEQENIQKNKKKNLTKQQKLKLGLYVPKMVVNTRMNVQVQNQYRQNICQNLYDLQKYSLKTGLRILQKQNQYQKFTMNKYINSIYKDIYARYLISKGIGIQWNGKYSTYGVLNSKNIQSQPMQMITQFLQKNKEQIQKVKSIAPYSYLTSKFISTSSIQVQNLRKIGYFLKFPLKNFGKYQKNFNKLIQNGDTIQLLVFSEYIQKLINPHALCIMPKHKMIIIKKKIIKQNLEKDTKQSSFKNQYLITSLQIFNKHKQIFQKQQYEKHLLFDSEHLIGMSVQYQLKNNAQAKYELRLIQQIQGYQRNPGIYVVNATTNLPDYQRFMFSQISSNQQQNKIKNVFDQTGRLKIKQEQKQIILSVIDLQFQDKLHQILKNQLNFCQIYDVFQDQIYSNKQTSQLLRFRLFDKYQIPLKQKSYKDLYQFLSNSIEEQSLILHQSKVQLPKKQMLKKPRQRRQYKKQIKKALAQKTSYMTLNQSIQSISNIPISSSIDSQYKVKVLVNKNQQIVKFIKNNQQIQNKQQDTYVTQILLSHDFISSFAYIFGTLNNNQILPAVIIQPQNITEQILPLALHLINFMKQAQEPKRGRKKSKQTQQKKSKRIIDSLKMIYLHPTLKQSQKDLDVQSFIQGSLKILNKQNYGYGYQAIRLWVCKNSNILGDRQILQKDINLQLKVCSSIRKLYSQIIPLMPSNNLLMQFNKEQLTFLDKFMLDQIDSYISNMQYFYSKLMIKQAYEYTVQFYDKIIDQVFVQTIRKNIIAYPNQKINLGHGIVIKRILQLLSVISPLFPFSVYHISKTQIMKWPLLNNDKEFYSFINQYNALIKIRIQLHNKLILNNFHNCEVIFSNSNLLNYSSKDLELFLGVSKVSFQQPLIKTKKFGFKLRFNQTLGGKSKIQVYQSNQTCIRCDSHAKQKQNLCKTCVDYLQQNIGQNIQFYDPKNNSLLINNQKEKIQDQTKRTNLQSLI